MSDFQHVPKALRTDPTAGMRVHSVDSVANIVYYEPVPVAVSVPLIPLNAVDLPYLIDSNVVTLAEARLLLGFPTNTGTQLQLQQTVNRRSDEATLKQINEQRARGAEPVQE